MMDLISTIITIAAKLADNVKTAKLNEELSQSIEVHTKQCVTDLKKFEDNKSQMTSKQEFVDILNELRKCIMHTQEQLDLYIERSCIVKLACPGCILEGLKKADTELLQAYSMLVNKVVMSKELDPLAVKKCLAEHELDAIKADMGAQKVILCAAENGAKITCPAASTYWHCSKCDHDFCPKCKRYYQCPYDHEIKHGKSTVATYCHYKCDKSIQYPEGTSGWVCSVGRKDCATFFICETCLPPEIVTKRCWEKHVLTETNKTLPIVATDSMHRDNFMCKLCNKTAKRSVGRWMCEECIKQWQLYEICLLCRKSEAPTPDKK